MHDCVLVDDPARQPQSETLRAQGGLFYLKYTNINKIISWNYIWGNLGPRIRKQRCTFEKIHTDFT